MRKVVNHLDFIVAAVVAGLYLIQDQGLITISAETVAMLAALAAIARGGLHRSRESKRKKSNGPNTDDQAIPKALSNSDATPTESSTDGHSSD